MLRRIKEDPVHAALYKGPGSFALLSQEKLWEPTGTEPECRSELIGRNPGLPFLSSSLVSSVAFFTRPVDSPDELHPLIKAAHHQVSLEYICRSVSVQISADSFWHK